MSKLRKVLLAISLFGMVFSSAGLAVTLLDRSTFEDATRRIVAWKVENRIERLFTPAPADGGGAFAAARNRLLEKANLAERLLASNYPEGIAERIARECVCRMDQQDRAAVQRRYEQAKETVETVVRLALHGEIELSRIGVETLDDLVAGYYVETVEGLKRDLRIFFGSNLLLYAAVAAGALWSPVGGALVAPAALLFLGTAISSGFYLFNQDWLATILFHDWTGFAYLGWVAFLTLLLCDVFLNYARVTLRIVSSLGISISGLC